LLLHCNGADGSTTFTDDSPAARAITVVGDTHIDTAVSVFGGASARFDGAGDRLTAAASSDFDFGSGDFTVELRGRVDSTAGNGVFVTYTPNGGAAAWLLRRTGAAWQFQVYSGSGFYGNSTFGTADVDTFYHLALVRDGNNLRRFVNGVGADVIDVTGVTLATLADPSLQIGGVFTNDPLAGWVDEIRITKGVARYTADFTPPTAEFEGAPTAPPSVAVVSAEGPLGAPTVLALGLAAAYALAPSVLAPPAALAFHDFTGVLGDVISLYVMDLITPAGAVRVPISSWQATLQTGSSNYVQCVIPAVTMWASAINAATEFVISRRAVLPSGMALEQEMARAPAEQAQFDRGPLRHTCTLSGYSTAFAANANPPAIYDRALTGVRSISSGASNYRARCAVDWLLRPGHRAFVDGVPFIVSYINYYGPSGFDSYMDVGS
jgi:hypothetical protein